jgi:hypothetical protein
MQVLFRFVLGTCVLFHLRSASLIEDVGLKTDGSYTNPDIEVKYEAGALKWQLLGNLLLFCPTVLSVRKSIDTQ